jgi:hypothetical protein
VSFDASVREFPQNDDARADLDQTVQPEPRERDRPRGHGGKGEYDDTDKVPGQGDALECDPTTQKAGIAHRGHARDPLGALDVPACRSGNCRSPDV